MITDVTTKAPAPAGAGRRRIVWGRLRELALVPAILVLLVVGSFVSPSFLSQANLVSILGASAALAMLVLAEALILITGKFDLSIESSAGLAPAIGALLVVPATAAVGFGTELPAGVALVAVIAVGAVVGLFNAILIVKFRLNAFIVTLAMLIVLRGLHVGVTEGQTLFDMPDAFFALATTTFVGVPLSVWLAVVAFAIAGFMLRYHRLGRALYAIGGNIEAARAAGIRVERVMIGVYVVGGVLAAVGGLILTGYVGAISANQGQNMIFTVFAAAVIGGISMDGGKGSMFGALTGVLLLGIVNNMLTIAQVSSFWIQAVQGAIILVALMIARVTSGRAQD
ncbi:ABC transporter permease [Actinorugispora endophytica]|uniref:Monosaccharide ABC transporter membrane protein (CUT2 family) n=1 Tax=Actinorugispora endophytica TaxID=1605990 RepID=A0A4R6UM10_9ACTN|nr:ABC transporter permease [Actinorugispora endophytica]TDQ46569.1 monosaccharide ABC transporter membrane protein (CUT2 family) [Actinorugispora endophytica]